MYTAFAEVYDQLMSDVDYGVWADLYTAIMNAYGIRGGLVCECACGTGSLTLALARRGFTMTGADISQEMLMQASAKARKAGLAIPFVCQDMRALRLHRPMDAVLATCDGLNYLAGEEDVQAFFRAAYAALRPGGAILFDVSTPYRLRSALGSQLIGYDTKDITYLWQNRWSERSAAVDMHLAIFVKQQDGSYRRIDEDQRQHAYGMRRLAELLEGTGFRQVNVFGADRLEPPRENEQRWHFAALKPVPEDEAGR